MLAGGENINRWFHLLVEGSKVETKNQCFFIS